MKGIDSGKISLRRSAQTYDVEIIGAMAGSRAACSHMMARLAKNVVVYLDNKEAVICLHTGRHPPASSKQILGV